MNRLSLVDHIAISLLTANKSFKVGIKQKKRAGRNNEYLSQTGQK